MQSKRGSRITVLLLLVLVMLTAITVMYADSEWRGDHVNKLTVRQDEYSLIIRWNRITSGEYRIDVSEDGSEMVSENVRTNSYELAGVEPSHEYTVTIYGKSDRGEYARGAKKTVTARNPQKIHTEVSEAEGFAGDVLQLGAVSSTSGLVYESGNENVLTVSESGEVTFIKAGQTEITITAPADEENLKESLIIPAVCYPDTLSTPSLEIYKKNDTSVVLRLKNVRYAESYELMRAAYGSDDYDVYRKFSADDFGRSGRMDIRIAKDIGSYCLRAESNAGKKKVKSKLSEPAVIEPDFDNAEIYSSLTNIIELGSDDVDLIVKASGSGSATVAQSMCFTGDGYAVAFVDRGNSVGCLKKYDLEGNEVAANMSTGHLGHANGCTYDPKTRRIYVMKTYASGKYYDIPAFSGETLAAEGSVVFNTAPSGIGYDATMKQFYLTASSRIYVTDEDLKMVRTIQRKRNYRSQDVAGYNGIALSCIWTGGSSSYIDMYRALNGDYLGSIYAPFGEIESACVEDGYLVMLFNGGYVYKTKNRVDFPG